MTDRLEITFAALDKRLESVTGLIAAQGPELGATGQELDGKTDGLLMKAAEAADFKGRSKQSLEVLAPAGLSAKRIVIVGCGKVAEKTQNDWVLLGGTALGQITARKCETASLIVDLEDGTDETVSEIAAFIAQGALLRHYTFRKYQTKASDTSNENNNNGAEATSSAKKAASRREGLHKLTIHCAQPDKAKAAFQRLKAIADGVMLARDLVNEPANALGPVEFAAEAKRLEKVGVDVEILDDKELKKLGFGSLLAVAQGSVRPARVAVMQWHGAKGKKAQKPVCFVGKGVVFDTGGISIKPAQGMEDMKGDMGGAACVTGLMHALAARKANVNAVGLIGLVENMPSGTATRPGDIVTSLSGQTIEVLNTDAEGRLVLADVMSYAIDRFKPRFVIDLATLTGAIMVALGKEYAGLYSNDDNLVKELSDASTATGEKVWRMPLDKAYDKLIDSKNADMKNIGGRWAGACTAAAFLQRFVGDTVWAHIDLAGTAMDSGRNEINQSWGSGWGVRLLDQLVAEHYEK
ncbi:MAG: leucyl aminopeptidase [Hyphomicrobiaceae bacterium]|nr:leucyl aminopeptidase [Hyphomicrobiaceae bacterium]